jgi:hypothetical protein
MRSTTTICIAVFIGANHTGGLHGNEEEGQEAKGCKEEDEENAPKEIACSSRGTLAARLPKSGRLHFQPSLMRRLQPIAWMSNEDP